MTTLHRALWAASILALLALAGIGWQAAIHALHPFLAVWLGLGVSCLGWACASLADRIAASYHVE